MENKMNCCADRDIKVVDGKIICNEADCKLVDNKCVMDCCTIEVKDNKLVCSKELDSKKSCC